MNRNERDAKMQGIAGLCVVAFLLMLLLWALVGV